MTGSWASIAVSIVNYRSADLVIRALPALRVELARFRNATVFIVDNFSPGDDAVVIEAHLASLPPGPEVRLVRSPRNGGFAAGNNLAFAALAGLGWQPDAVLLLNPDAEVRPGAILEMLRVMQAEPRAGVVGARLENPDGSTWTAAFHFPSLLREFAGAAGGPLQRRWPMVVPGQTEPFRADWVGGAAMLVRAEALAATGGMDEGYFLYFEEIDFMKRLAGLGWETWHAPAALVLHEPGSSTGIVDGRPRSGRMPDYWFRSWSRYFVKNHGPLQARLAAALKLAGLAVRVMHCRLRGRDASLAPGFIGDFARNCLFARP